MSAMPTARTDYARIADEELLLVYRQERDPGARDELVRRFIPFARKLALRYVHSREPLDDLVQVACLGLLNALARFEPGTGKKFTSYAAPTIMGELKRHFRDKGWSVHVPRDLQERALAVSRQTEHLSAQIGRSPTVDELAAVNRVHGRAGDRGARRRASSAAPRCTSRGCSRGR
jgi:RNA polymerase sigma-B factor